MKTLFRLYRSALLFLLLPCALGAGVQEAVSYLEREVPKWKRDNGCYSCHNNGDALRGLLSARRAGFAVGDQLWPAALPALETEWEAKPLARLQLAAAVRDAAQAGLVERTALVKAAETVAADQLPDGHWRVEEELSAGSPVTYGPVLATYLAREVLAAAGGHADSVARANEWLAARKPHHVMETAALVLALRRPPDAEALLAAQAPDGSWGGEAFDTALAVLALAPTHPVAVAKARVWLLKTQWSGGGWAATTRPGGGDSYAQHISTTAWVLQALTAAPPAKAAER